VVFYQVEYFDTRLGLEFRWVFKRDRIKRRVIGVAGRDNESPNVQEMTSGFNHLWGESGFGAIEENGRVVTSLNMYRKQGYEYRV